MAAYYVTWFFVAFFSSLAWATDYPHSCELCTGKVRHSLTAKIFLLFTGAVLIFVAGCRYYIGSDYFSYYADYNSYVSSLGERLDALDEPGLSLIYWLVYQFVDDGFACVFVSNAIMIYLVLKVLNKYTDNTMLATVLFALTFWIDTFNGMRQALAVSLVFCGLPYLKERKLCRFCIIIFLAFLCHKSSIVCFLLYFALHRKVNRKNVFILAIASVAVAFSLEYVFRVTNYILDKNLNRSSTYIANSVNLLRTLSNVAPALFFGGFYRRKARGKEEEFCLNILLVQAFISVATCKSAYLARLNLYLAPFEVYSIAELTKGLSKSNRRVMTAVIIGLFFIFETYEIMHKTSLSPFRWIWSR